MTAGGAHGWRRGEPADQFEARILAPDVYVVTEYAFDMRVPADSAIALSREHTTYRWLPYAEGAKPLAFDSNRTALRELNERLRRDNGAACA